MTIELKNICKSFEGKEILRDVSAVFKTGITCVMGQSGIGKTTLAKIIAGLIVPDSGELSFSKPAENLKFSAVFQEDRLLDWETALGNVLFVNPDRERAVAFLNEAELGENLHKKAADLSGGMRRRVCICRALIADYDVLILDEPFKGLDVGLKISIMQMVKTHARGIVICITHDEGEAEFLGGDKFVF
ncbi:MAG: ATP-binding cassette domain-containing protein [Defluviitaleaceae bacterium]|nr:ATP-binding cassette domain-containing protein [Defluviitaleaceae bacterium]